MKTVSDIIHAFGGNAAVARIIGARHPSNVSEMRRRENIPVKYWDCLIAAASDSATAERDRRPIFNIEYQNFVEAVNRKETA